MGKGDEKLIKMYNMYLYIYVPWLFLGIGTLVLFFFTAWIWPALIYFVADLLLTIYISIHCYRRVNLICPHCNEEFRISYLKMVFAAQTFNERKATCPKCKQKSFCTEIYNKKIK